MNFYCAELLFLNAYETQCTVKKFIEEKSFDIFLKD